MGQKQLLSFARALAHDPRILVLDEATSSVDTETEGLIQEALQVLLRGRTAIVIAHRLSTVQNVDQILVMHKGRIRERGGHQELLARRGLYWRLYQLQYKDQEMHAPAAPPWVPEPAGAAPAPRAGADGGPRLLLALSTLILCTALLLLAELVLRRLHPDALDERPEAGLARLHRYSEVYGWELRPGARATIDGHLDQREPLGPAGRGARHRAHGREGAPGACWATPSPSATAWATRRPSPPAWSGTASTW